MKRRSLFVLLFIGVFTRLSLPQDLRQSAEQRFNSIEWTESPDQEIGKELPGKNLPGGNETFPLLTPSNGSPGSAIYPSFGTIGILDYTSMGNELLAASRRIAVSLKSGALDPSAFSNKRPWLPVLVNYRLKELDKPETVRFSAAREDDPEKPVVRFASGTDKLAKMRLYTVTFVKEDAQWVVWDLLFSGDTDGNGALSN